MAGARFVKTSTGFSGSGATVHHVSLMKSTVGSGVEVKASGDSNSSNCTTNVTKAGATRLGASRGPGFVRLNGEHHFEVENKWHFASIRFLIENAWGRN